MPPPPELMEELVEEVLLRVPPDDPARLFAMVPAHLRPQPTVHCPTVRTEKTRPVKQISLYHCASVPQRNPLAAIAAGGVQRSSMPPPELLEENYEEILLRFPPDDHACLFRAALACKRWCRLISSARFRRRFRKFHRSPPLLGAIHCQRSDTRFWPASSSRPPYAVDRAGCYAIDARHGRILYYDPDFVVLDPVTGQEWRLSLPHPASM
ncbi:hypothetical protein PR202_ga28542 [Eleusine coracana subsp. coracana]|uniref:F-box domain-containing protein n=1 Tax=Eleusine coracana subsp. coracana TaxID=191504 RepID=A0AAV5DJI4_ELECO|nr:hypothetical protein PR202_ga28542 [Eleusine coracana subsp. coracana]